MPNIYLKNELYDDIVRLGANPTEFVEEAVNNALQQRKEEKK